MLERRDKLGNGEQEMGLVGRPKPVEYAYRLATATLRDPSPLWRMAVVDGREPVSTDPDRQLLGRISEVVSAKSEELLNSAHLAVAAKAREEFESLENGLYDVRAETGEETTQEEVGEAISDITNPLVLALFDALADVAEPRFLTPKGWAKECVNGLNSESFEGSDPTISMQVILAQSTAIVAHFAKPEQAPSPKDVFRYRNRWFSITEVTDLGIGVQPLIPLIAFGLDEETQYQVIVPLRKSEVFHTGGVVTFKTESEGQSREVAFTGEKPIGWDDLKIINGSIMIDAASLTVSAGGQGSLMQATYGTDSLVLMTDNKTA